MVVPRLALLMTCVLSMAALLPKGGHTEGGGILLVALGTAGCGAIAFLEHRRPRLGIVPIGCAVAIVLAVAVWNPPRGSGDLWSYAMYGRTVSVHHANPYREAPSAFPDDPFLERVGSGWRHTRSVYGPVFVGYAAVGTVIGAESPLRTRLFFQLTAAAAVAAVLLMLWRRTRSPAVIAWVGLNPVIAASVVNGGHNDAWIGLGILASVLLMTSGRARAAGVVLGIAALVKVTALLALVGLAVWAWRRGRRRAAAPLVLSTLGVLAVGYIPVSPDAVRALIATKDSLSRVSDWHPLLRLLTQAGLFAAGTTEAVGFERSITAVALGAVGVLAVLVAWRRYTRSDPAPSTAAAVATFTFVGNYVLPWYTFWALPLVAASRRNALAWVVWLQGATMLAAYQLPRAATGGAFDATARVLLTDVCNLLLGAAFVVFALRRPAEAPLVPARGIDRSGRFHAPE